MIFSLLIAALAVITVDSQSLNYSSSPFYVSTFDRAPTSIEKGASSFTHVTAAQGRRGSILFNRANRDYLNLLTYADNFNRTLPLVWGGEVTVETWVLGRDFRGWQRAWEFSLSPTNATTGEINANPTGEDVTMIWSPDSATSVRYGVGVGTAQVNHATPTASGRVGDWVHIVATSELVAGANPAVVNSGRNTVYINGVLQVTGLGWLPKVTSRNLAWVGRSAFVANGDPFFHGFVDMIAVYNYPLSAEAVFAHMQVERPPVFEATFSKNPSLVTGSASPSFGWVATELSSAGVVTLNGSQSIDLLNGNTIGTTMTTVQGGASSGSPVTAGWTYSSIVKFNALAVNTPVFDFKDAGVNRVRMFVSATNNVVFNWNTVSVTSTSVLVTGRFYHLVATVSATGEITLYVDNSTNSITGAAPSAITFTSAFLGQSTDASPVFLTGSIDAFRVYDMALSNAEVRGLTSTVGGTPDGLGSTKPRALTAVKASGPVVSYTFDSPPGAVGTEGFSNWTWIETRSNNADRSGMAYFDGTYGMMSLSETRDNNGNLHPTLYGGDLSFETRFQFDSSANQAMIFSLFGPRASPDDNIHLMNTFWQANGQTNSFKFEIYGGGSSSAGFCYGCTNGSWAHAIVSVRQYNASDSTSAVSGEFNIFVNGMSVWTGYGYLPRYVNRPSNYLGLSPWVDDEKFNGHIDAYHMYNYALSAEAAMVHAALPLPPQFELVFTTSPVIVGSQFSWMANDTTDVHVGVMNLAATQFVNLSATSGPNFVGFTIPSFMGTGRSTPGVFQSQDEGWSFHIVFRTPSFTAGQTLVEFADVAGASALKLAFTATTLVFTSGSASIDCGPMNINSWTDVTINIVQDRAFFEGQCFVNGARIRSVPSFPAIAYVNRNSVLLGRSNTGSATTFVGDIDAFRVMAFAVTSEDAYQLWSASSRADRFFSAPAYSSGPLVSHSFDEAPYASNDPTSAQSYNNYLWARTGPAYSASANHTGVVIFNSTLASNALRQYVDLNFDRDAFGNTLPQVIGGSLSFETWINFATPPRPGQAVFDIGDNPGTAWNGAQGAGQYNILLASALTGTATNVTFESFHLPNVATAISGDFVTPGTWQHITSVITAGTNNVSVATIYVNGVMRANGTMTTPPARFRRAAWLGRSNWNRPSLDATMSSFYVYNYALDVSQIQMHMTVPYPPTFDASFNTNPLFNTQGSNYGWLEVDPTAQNHRGVLNFNGQAQYVDLTQGTGGLSIGQIFPIIGGPSIGTSDMRGWTLEVSAKWASLSNSKIFDLSNGGDGGVDSFSLGNEGAVVKLYTQNGLTDEKSNITLFTATVSTWYHIIVTATPVAGSNDTMTYTLYLNGVRSTSSVGWAPLPMIRRVAYLARSTETLTAPPTWFSGSIDLLRYYSYVTSADVVRSLFQLSDSIPVVPSSSSSTGAASSSSSSVASSSSSSVVSSSSSSAASSSSSAVVSSSSSSSRSSSSSSSSSAISSSSSVAPTQCRGAGYNFDSLVGRVITLDANSGGTNPSYYRYAVSPCGTISQAGLCAGMVCQNMTTLSRWNPDWQVTSWWAINNGVNMQVENGDLCGATARRVDINWICNAAATTPNLLSITETTACRYTLIIHTALACTPTGSTGGQGVGDDYYSDICGGGAYDISSLASQDITGIGFRGYNWTTRVCGLVTNPTCAPVQPVSVCQTQGTTAWRLTNYMALPSMYSINDNGMNITSFTGDDCGAFRNRTTITKLVCVPTATTPAMVLATEPSTCVYLFIINTNAVCGAPFQIRSSSSSTAVVPSSSSSRSSSSTGSSSSSSPASSSSSSSSSGSSSASSSSASSSSSSRSSSSSSGSSTSQPSSVTVIVSSSSSSSDDSSSSGVTEIPDEGINGAINQSVNLVVLIVAAVIAVIVA